MMRLTEPSLVCVRSRERSFKDANLEGDMLIDKEAG